MKRVIAPLSVLAVLLCIFSPALLYVDQILVGREGLRQMPWIIGVVSPAYYMGDKAIRFLCCALSVAIYGFAVREGILPFAVNLFVLYLVTMLFTNIYCIRQEKKLKK